MRRIDRRTVLRQGGAAVVAGNALVGAAHAQQRIVLNDASRLNPTPVFRHWVVGPDQKADLVARLRVELKEATVANRPIAVSTARHSLGGQSLPRDGTAITLATKQCELDTKARTFIVDGGTRWSQVIAKLDPAGFSPAVMQSNNDFGVAATYSVNAHGWPVPYGPFGSTVKRIELMLADGTIVNCSRTEHAELFRLAMGGYGYFGIILQVEAEMAENLMLKPQHEVMPSTQFAEKFITAAHTPGVLMLYGRMSVAMSSLMSEGLIVSYRTAPAGAAARTEAASSGGFVSAVSREVYRAQVGSDSAKKARWLAETVANPRATSGIASRNSLMNEPVANLASRDRNRTDILHEYFIPPARLNEFVTACRELIPRHGQELLNITLRYVAADETSAMAFAPTPRIAGVMSFSQQVTPEAEASMMRFTEAMIDRVADIGGSFYLPYRLHARVGQVARVYPGTTEFVARKKHYDPRFLFRNAMWPLYFAPHV